MLLLLVLPQLFWVDSLAWLEQLLHVLACTEAEMLLIQQLNM